MKKILVIMMSLFVATGVYALFLKKQVLEKTEYCAWVEKSGKLAVEKQIGALNFSLSFIPLDYWAVKETQGDTLFEADYKELISAYEDYQYFNLRVGASTGEDLLNINLSGPEEYGYRLDYLSAAMKKDIRLIDGSDTLSCQVFHYERNYGLTPYSSFLIGFDRSQMADLNVKTFVLDATELGAGIVKLRYDKGVLADIPQLKTYKK